MRSERWSSDREWSRILKKDASGPVLQYADGNCYSFDGEGHVMILGVSGSGKSRRGTIPMTKSFIKNHQSAIIADAKGEIYESTKNEIPDNYDVHVIDFRNLYEKEAEGWNPLHSPYELWCSKNAKDRHIAEQMVEELAHSIYPEAKNTDPFWIHEARNVFTALVYMLFEYAKPEEINLASIYYLLSKGEEKCKDRPFGTYLERLVHFAKGKENISMQLQSFITTANDTKAGIRSVFLDGLSVATKSESIRKFLGKNDLNINHLSGEKPTLIYIIIPDETPIYDELTGVLVSQLINHYVRMAEQDYSGKLPIRVNVLLEELGNIGKAITNLPHLMTAGRSRNIRVQFVLQSLSQLVDIYGTSSATTILSNCDVRIAFRLNNWETLTELSRMCGEKEVNYDGHISREPLITQSQLAAMETGQALVIISGRTKFITWIPDYTEMYPVVKTYGFKRRSTASSDNKICYFDIKEFLIKSDKADKSKTNSNVPNFMMIEQDDDKKIPTFEEFMEMKRKGMIKPINSDEPDFEFNFDFEESDS